MLPGEVTPAAAASFRQRERDTRVLARDDAVRGDIRAVRKDVEKLVEHRESQGRCGKEAQEA